MKDNIFSKLQSVRANRHRATHSWWGRWCAWLREHPIQRQRVSSIWKTNNLAYLVSSITANLSTSQPLRKILSSEQSIWCHALPYYQSITVPVNVTDGIHQLALAPEGAGRHWNRQVMPVSYSNYRIPRGVYNHTVLTINIECSDHPSVSLGQRESLGHTVTTLLTLQCTSYTSVPIQFTFHMFNNCFAIIYYQLYCCRESTITIIDNLSFFLCIL